MPMYKQHLLGGFACGVVMLFFVFNYLVPHAMSLATAFEWMLCTLAGSLFPDVDVKSKGQQLFYKLIMILIIISLYKGYLNLVLCLLLFSIIPIFVRHRGLFHTSWFITILPLSSALLASYYVPSYSYSLLYDVAFFIAGAFSHLIMDFGIKGLVHAR